MTRGDTVTMGRLAGLWLVVLLALLHGASHALIRPLYQVSDEVVYLSTVQEAALAHPGAASLAACVAPPDGRHPRVEASTKPGFLAVASFELRTLCRIAATRPALLWLRVLNAVSLAVVAACAWAIARLLTGREADAWLAGLLVAAHPVAATHAGGVAPDGWANAFSALSLLAATRLLGGRARWFDWPLLLAAVLAAYAWKDTTAFLLALPPLVLLLKAPRVFRGSSRAWLRVPALAAVAGLGLAAALLWFRSPYLAMIAPRGTRLSPLDLAGAVVADLLSQLGTFLGGTWTALGNFGANTLSASPVATAIGALLVGAGVLGGIWRWSRSSQPVSRAVLIAWTLSGLLCLLQPSVRQVLLGTQDIHQGRWLLPMLAPAAVALAFGLNGLRDRPWQVVPLASLASFTAAWSGILETTRYFWDAYPVQLRESALYIRGTGGGVIDDALILGLVRATAAGVPAALPLSCLGVLLIVSVACLGYAGQAHRQASATWPAR